MVSRFFTRGSKPMVCSKLRNESKESLSIEDTDEALYGHPKQQSYPNKKKK